MADINKEELEKEIAKILENADLANTSTKKVIQQLEKNLGTDLKEKKSLIDQLVMNYVNSKESGDDDDGEDDDDKSEEEEEDKKKKPAKRGASKKQESEDEDESENSFTNQEYADIIYMYGRANQNAELAQKYYQERFPKRQLPRVREFVTIFKRLRETGDCHKPSSYLEEEPKKKSKRPAPKEYKRDQSDDDEESEEEKKPVKKKGRKKKGSDGDSDSDWSKKKEKTPKGKKAGGGRGKGGGYTRAYKLSPALADLMGKDEMPRHEVVKRVWEIIKEKKLYDPNNKQFAVCDDALYKVFGTKRFRCFGMMKYLKSHFLDE